MTTAQRFLSIAAGALVMFASTSPVIAGTTEDVLTVYSQFAAAQNTRDLAKVGAFFIDGPEFLWVSDGRSYWGRDAVLERMAGFQKAERWVVLPALDKAQVIELDANVALLHMPLVLEAGTTAVPDKLPFLVSILFQKSGDTWQIAALLTTQDKGPAQ